MPLGCRPKPAPHQDVPCRSGPFRRGRRRQSKVDRRHRTSSPRSVSPIVRYIGCEAFSPVIAARSSPPPSSDPGKDTVTVEWSRTVPRDRRTVELRLDGRSFRRGHCYSKQPPLPVHILKLQVEIDAQRTGGEKACHTQFSTPVQRRFGRKLRSDQGGGKQIEVAAAQVGKTLRQIGGGVSGLKVGRG